MVCIPEAARQTDKAKAPVDAHGNQCCPHSPSGPIIQGSPNVFINGLPAARKGDPGIHIFCCGPNKFNISGGSGTVFVNGKPLARKGDSTSHCGGSGSIQGGSGDVFSG